MTAPGAGGIYITVVYDDDDDFVYEEEKKTGYLEEVVWGQQCNNNLMIIVEVLGLNSEAASIISEYSSTLPKRRHIKGF
eukprot:CAMPEP_0206384518 /NCGR_PEP_ID=MMETSP0294-20121207/14636_1 /ASSEMBLY_ACC=CAM_ASM_000327 /TAXON_ID=39354 /ORGANISM="Heterosigma akashiwo, Strain CCMP2393" /LENGTH=78 /DNA_ID=CAMNT_0053834871 /DNA_START=95 /DNA_END=331 /DNA_ORIENTATION=-